MTRTGAIIGVVVVLALGVGSIVYTYLGTVTDLPSIGLGLQIDSSVLLGSIVMLGLVMGVILFGYLRSKGER